MEAKAGRRDEGRQKEETRKRDSADKHLQMHEVDLRPLRRWLGGSNGSIGKVPKPRGKFRARSPGEVSHHEGLKDDMLDIALCTSPGDLDGLAALAEQQRRHGSVTSQGDSVPGLLGLTDS
ncbi:hypothetical protein VTJ04DRAFT_1443 [Mycothermus thermophilus]|uniref:uncharacterized protein n=1 Tax=Humicola insolens TaxID=85995 RepID=UPI003743C43F